MEAKTRKNSDFSAAMLLMNNKALIILIVFCLALTIATDKFLTTTNIMNVVRQVSGSIILGVGFTLTLGAGNLDLSVGSMLGLISMVTCKLSIMEGMPFAIVIVLGLLLGAVCGAGNGLIAQIFKIPAMITTVATKNIFQGLTFIISKNTSVTGLPKAYVFLGQGYIGPFPFQILLMIAIVIIGYLVLNRTTFGRHCLCVGGNMEAARVSGINVFKTKV